MTARKSECLKKCGTWQTAKGLFEERSMVIVAPSKTQILKTRWKKKRKFVSGGGRKASCDWLSCGRPGSGGGGGANAKGLVLGAAELLVVG